MTTERECESVRASAVLRLISALIFLAAPPAVFAAEFTWTGGGSDARWSNPLNWSVAEGYPGSSGAGGDTVVFGGDATVLFDVPGTEDGVSGVKTVKIGGISVSGGKVTIQRDEGAGAMFLAASGEDRETIAVAENAELALGVDLYSDSSVYRYGLGKVVYSARICICADSRSFALEEGENVFEESSTVDISRTNGDFYMSSEKQSSLKIVFRGKVTSSRYAGGSVSTVIQDYDVSQEDGADVRFHTAVFAEHKPSRNDTARYTVKGGKFAATILSVNGAKDNAGREGYEHFVVDGGDATVGYFQLDSGSASLLDGTLAVDWRITSADSARYRFNVKGGTFAYNVPVSQGPLFTPSAKPFIAWDGDFTFKHVPELVWDWRGVDVGDDARYTDGGGTIRFPADFVPEEDAVAKRGLAVAPGATTEISPGTVFRPKAGSISPWKVSLGVDARLVVGQRWSFSDPVCTRLSLPLELDIAQGAVFAFHGRGAAVAHKVVYDGVEAAKGVYSNDGACPWIAMSASDPYNLRSGGVNVIVPYVWTGAGGDGKWDTAANWDGDTVPPDGAPVDLSRATEVELDRVVTASAIVAMPSGANKKITLRGAGSVTLSIQEGRTALYVSDDAELVFDVDVRRDNGCFYGMVGGGRFVFRKSWPGSHGVTAASAGVDGTVVFAAGESDVVRANAPVSAPSSSDVFSVVGFDNQYLAEVEFAGNYEGATLSPVSQTDTYPCPGTIRQCAGRVEFGKIYLENYLADCSGRHVCTYRLSGGELACSADYIMMNGSWKSSAGRFGLSGFEMDGGSVYTRGFFLDPEGKSRLDLHGGTVYLEESPWSWYDGSSAVNPLRLGGVTLRPRCANRSFSGHAYLSGVNGNVKFDCTDKFFTVYDGAVFDGPGGIECTGGTLLIYSPKMTFEGPLHANGGTIECRATKFDGVREIRTTASYFKINSGCTVVTQPDVIDISAPWTLVISDDIEFRPKKLIVGGGVMPEGVYTYGTGRVIVGPAVQTDWTADGDVSHGSGSEAELASDTALSSLVCNTGRTPGVKTVVSETGAVLTLTDGAVVTVGDGATLVVDVDVVVAGAVTKKGNGKIVFRGNVSGSGSFTARAGSVDVESVVTGVVLATSGADGAMPVLTLESGCTVTGGARILTAESPVAAWGYVNGRTVQNGASVIAEGVCELGSDPQGGTAEYVMNGGSISAAGVSGCDITVIGTATFSGAAVSNDLVATDGAKLRLEGVCSLEGAVDAAFGLVMPEGAVLKLDGNLAFDSLEWKGAECRRGVYRPGEKAFGRNALAGYGTIAVANGNGPGFTVIFR